MAVYTEFLTVPPAVSLAGSAAGNDCAYAYADSFTDNRVETDSYMYSLILNQFPTYIGPPWLMFVTDSTGDRGLGFYSGERDMAFVYYYLPRVGSAEGTAGSLQLDALPTVTLGGGWGFGSAYVYIRNDDGLATTTRIYQPGHCQFALAPSPTTSKIIVGIFGGVFRLDNLSVCLDAATPTRVTTWGRVKSIYR